MFEEVELPTRVAELNACLSDVKVDDLAHLSFDSGQTDWCAVTV